jgi:hypothetical protein
MSHRRRGCLLLLGLILVVMMVTPAASQPPAPTPPAQPDGPPWNTVPAAGSVEKEALAPEVLAGLAKAADLRVAIEATDVIKTNKVRTENKTVRDLLTAIGEVGGMTWEAKDRSAVFAPAAPPRVVEVAWLRSGGFLKTIDAANKALDLLESLSPSQQASLLASSALPLSAFTKEQLTQLRALPSGRVMPTVDGKPLIDLPAERLFFTSGFNVVCQVEKGSRVHRVYLTPSGPSLNPPPLTRPRVKKAEAPAPGGECGAQEAAAEMAELLEEPAPPAGQPAIKFDTTGGVYRLDDLAARVRKQGGPEVYVDSRHGKREILLVFGKEKEPIPVETLLAVMAKTTGLSWRTVGPTKILVAHLVGVEEARFESIQRGVQKEQSKLTRRMLGAAQPLLGAALLGKIKPEWLDEQTVTFRELSPDLQAWVLTGLRKAARTIPDKQLGEVLLDADYFLDAKVSLALDMSIGVASDDGTQWWGGSAVTKHLKSE